MVCDCWNFEFRLFNRFSSSSFPINLIVRNAKVKMHSSVSHFRIIYFSNEVALSGIIKLRLVTCTYCHLGWLNRGLTCSYKLILLESKGASFLDLVLVTSIPQLKNHSWWGRQNGANRRMLEKELRARRAVKMRIMILIRQKCEFSRIPAWVDTFSEKLFVIGAWRTRPWLKLWYQTVSYGYEWSWDTYSPFRLY